MTPTARKIVSTVITLVAAALIFAAVLRPSGPATPPATSPPPTTDPSNGAPTTDGVGSDGGTAPNPTVPPDPSKAAETPTVAAPTAATAVGALTARAPSGPAPESPAPIGSLDPTLNPYRIEFTPNAAGIRSITSAAFWRTAADRVAAAAHRANPAAPMPPDSQRHVLAEATPLFHFNGSTPIPVLAAHTLEVNGAPVDLFGRVWSELAPGHFATELADAAGVARIRVERRYELTQGSYDLSLRQTVTNLGDAPAKIRWIQYGPSELPAEDGASIEVRRFHFGYLHNLQRDPAQTFVLTTGQMFEHSTAASTAGSADNTLWRNPEAVAGGFSLSWYATTSRYFAFAVHAPGETIAQPAAQGGGKSISDRIERVTVQSNLSPVATEVLLLSAIHSPEREIAAGASTSFDIDVYAGPLDPKIIARQEPYASLDLRQSIVYALSSCCTFCTFAWLANLMASFLTLLHDYVVFDWGFAIIVLVIVVRTLLHPLMKSSQIKMQRFGRAMAELKPELDALQKRYRDDPKTLQLEQMRLYREKKVNPAGCVGGILPTFLQMPIWIALYAVLYFAFELRHAPAFFGLFQSFGGWSFLGDLSRPDNFFEFGTPINLGLFYLRGVNLLPLLMGFVFFLQQKYMTPPTPNMTPEQETQQKMMKVMMVVMFPLMLYVAPSGLTLYILTSTCIGIIESKRVKAHIDKYGLAEPPKAQRTTGGGLYARMLEMQKQKEAAKEKRTFKERG
jgi:YidC/Oxa1 family membrane protein insertase